MRAARSLVIVASFLVMACGGGTEPAAGGNGGNNGGNNTCTSTSTNVTVANNSYTPSCTTVPVGTTVTWTWSNASNGHDVLFTTGSSSDIQTSGTFTRSFPTAGTFNYSCSVHGAGMSGRIVVQ